MQRMIFRDILGNSINAQFQRSSTVFDACKYISSQLGISENKIFLVSPKKKQNFYLNEEKIINVFNENPQFIIYIICFKINENEQYQQLPQFNLQQNFPHQQKFNFSPFQNQNNFQNRIGECKKVKNLPLKHPSYSIINKVRKHNTNALYHRTINDNVYLQYKRALSFCPSNFQQLINQVAQLGYQIDDIKESLRESNYDVQMAIEILISRESNEDFNEDDFRMHRNMGPFELHHHFGGLGLRFPIRSPNKKSEFFQQADNDPDFGSNLNNWSSTDQRGIPFNFSTSNINRFGNFNNNHNNNNYFSNKNPFSNNNNKFSHNNNPFSNNNNKFSGSNNNSFGNNNIRFNHNNNPFSNDNNKFNHNNNSFNNDNNKFSHNNNSFSSNNNKFNNNNNKSSHNNNSFSSNNNNKFNHNNNSFSSNNNKFSNNNNKSSHNKNSFSNNNNNKYNTNTKFNNNNNSFSNDINDDNLISIDINQTDSNYNYYSDSYDEYDLNNENNHFDFTLDHNDVNQNNKKYNAFTPQITNPYNDFKTNAPQPLPVAQIEPKEQYSPPTINQPKSNISIQFSKEQKKNQKSLEITFPSKQKQNELPPSEDFEIPKNPYNSEQPKFATFDFNPPAQMTQQDTQQFTFTPLPQNTFKFATNPQQEQNNNNKNEQLINRGFSVPQNNLELKNPSQQEDQTHKQASTTNFSFSYGSQQNIIQNPEQAATQTFSFQPKPQSLLNYANPAQQFQTNQIQSSNNLIPFGQNLSEIGNPQQPQQINQNPGQSSTTQTFSFQPNPQSLINYANPAQRIQATTTPVTQPFSFGQNPSEIRNPQQPQQINQNQNQATATQTFSFPPNPQSLINYANPAQQFQATTPPVTQTFSFGQNLSGIANPSQQNIIQNPEQSSTQTFSFGQTSQNLFDFSNPAPQINQTQAQPIVQPFSFGQTNMNNQEQPASNSFSFRTNSQNVYNFAVPSQQTNQNQEQPKAQFNFSVPSQQTNQNQEQPKTHFNFAVPSQQTNQNQEQLKAQQFSFGFTNQPQQTQEQPASNSFSFGKNSQNTFDFTIPSQLANTNQEQPTFHFKFKVPSQQTNQNQEQPKTQSFSFGEISQNQIGLTPTPQKTHENQERATIQLSFTNTQNKPVEPQQQQPPSFSLNEEKSARIKFEPIKQPMELKTSTDLLKSDNPESVSTPTNPPPPHQQQQQEQEEQIQSEEEQENEPTANKKTTKRKKHRVRIKKKSLMPKIVPINETDL